MGQFVYGECVRSGEAMIVRISALADAGCDLETEGHAGPVPIDGECALWIGAMGPFAATAQHKDAGQLALRFKEPLPVAIVTHFNGG